MRSPYGFEQQIPLPTPAEGRRGRNTGLILLVAAGAAALAAGVAWGVATGNQHKAASAGDTNAPVVVVQTFDAAQQADYQVTGLKAQAAGTSVTVTWGAPAKTDGISSYVIVAGLHDKDVKDTTVAAGTYTATITGLHPGTQYCFSVITLAHAPGDTALHMAKPTTCFQATTGAGDASPGPGA